MTWLAKFFVFLVILSTVLAIVAVITGEKWLFVTQLGVGFMCLAIVIKELFKGD